MIQGMINSENNMNTTESTNTNVGKTVWFRLRNDNEHLTSKVSKARAKKEDY